MNFKILMLSICTMVPVSLSAQQNKLGEMPADVQQVIDKLKKESIKNFLFFRQWTFYYSPRYDNGIWVYDNEYVENQSHLFWQQGNETYCKSVYGLATIDSAFNLAKSKKLPLNNPFTFYLKNKNVIDKTELHFYEFKEYKRSGLQAPIVLSDGEIAYEFWFITGNKSIYKSYWKQYVDNKENIDMEINRKSKLNELRLQITDPYELDINE